MSKLRDNFPQKIIEILAKRAGQSCSHLVCKRPTSISHSDDARAVNLGVAAHISAASPGGPRYDSRLSQEQRSSIDNAIWLCQICAKLIDSDQDYFTVQLLGEWRKNHESEVFDKAMGNAESSFQRNYRSSYFCLMEQIEKQDSINFDIEMGTKYLPPHLMPDHADAVKFSKSIPEGYEQDDPNSEIWYGTASTDVYESIEGVWHSRWNRENETSQEPSWYRGTAVCKKAISYRSGTWYQINFDDNISPYIILAQLQDERLIGRFINCTVESDCYPWVGVIVNNNRIDGYWPLGRWDCIR